MRWRAPTALALIAAVSRQAAPQPATLPFSVGEQADYNVKFGIIRVGSGTMTVAGVDTLRGDSVWHVVFHIEGGTFFYHVNDQLESWFTTHTLSSFRFLQHLEEGGTRRYHDYQIYPDRQAFVEDAKPVRPSVAEPLDDAAFLYFIRTIPLTVGETYTFNRYFNPKSNPVVIHVLRRERVNVPAGTFNAVVIQPIIKTSGIFSEHGEARLWLSDDAARAVLQLKSRLSFGTLDLYMRAFHAAPGAPAPIPLPRGSNPTPPSDTTDSASGGHP
jgi:hypothetical protein